MNELSGFQMTLHVCSARTNLQSLIVLQLAAWLSGFSLSWILLLQHDNDEQLQEQQQGVDSEDNQQDQEAEPEGAQEQEEGLQEEEEQELKTCVAILQVCILQVCRN